MRVLKWVLWTALGAGAVAVLLGLLHPAYVFGPLGGLLIYRFGTASLGSLRRGASYIPSGPPQPVDVAAERVTYWCEGCGAELLLLVRGTAIPPRHCGERMAERHEVARESPA